MALRIPCPTCGTRSIEEWVHGEIFAVPEAVVDARDREIDRSFFHNNSEGVVEEAWFHLYGCRRWIRVRRDTRTDEFVSD